MTISAITKIFNEGYGFNKSIEKSLPIDADEQPIPLYTYPAIEYLKSLDFSNKKIFEFGSGHSTLFWLNKGACITSVENSKKWFEQLSQKTQDQQNFQIIFAKKDDYINSILNSDTRYDVIIIDANENRFQCTQNAIKKIKDDGIIIIDNSDWFENSTKLIRDQLDFIQSDFYGFRPSKQNTSVTSIFFSRKVKLEPITNKQPSFAIGGLQKHSRNDLCYLSSDS